MRLGWVVLTMGDRWPATRAALGSLVQHSPGDSILLVLNGCEGIDLGELASSVETLALPVNVGIPAGRDAGVQAFGVRVDIVGFLDDDALLRTPDGGRQIAEVFAASADVAAVAMRIVDEEGQTARRHVPRFGTQGSAEPGGVVTFLGGASAVRRSAYDEVGGYWGELFYSHEELELSWRFHDAGYSVIYEPGLLVEHPRTDIGRHADGWSRTGRNRVRIARRNLPVPIAAAHTAVWFAGGLVRAPGIGCKQAYAKGWLSGWRGVVDRQPMRWATVWRLTRLGRPPIV